MIFYIYDINEIIGEPIKNRSESELNSTHERTLDYPWNHKLYLDSELSGYSSKYQKSKFQMKK